MFKELTVLAVVGVCLQGALLSGAWADPIGSAQDADSLCDNSAPMLETTNPDVDPVLETQRRHVYAIERQTILTRVYSVLLDTEQYRFLPDDPGVVRLDTLSPFELFDGAYTLDLGTLVDLGFLLDDATFERVEVGYASDQVLLRLYFYLVSLDDPDQEFCSLSTDGMTRSLAGQALAAELVTRDTDEVLARTQTERLVWGSVRLGMETGPSYSPPLPSVTVTDTVLPIGADTDEADLLRIESEVRLMPCYLRGLTHNGRLQGAIVLGYSVERDGSLVDPSIIIDAVDEPILTGCVVGALDQIVLPRRAPRPQMRVRMTVYFHLE